MNFGDIDVLQLRNGAPQQPCTVELVTAPKKSAELFGEQASGSNYEWVLVEFYYMEELIDKYQCWFDRYGNLCSEHGHLAPSFFKYLGEKVHVKKDSGFGMSETDWLKRSSNG